jgi:HK97 family phage major capsid protein
MSTILEQIAAYEAKRAANVAAMKAIMDKSGEEGATLDAGDQEEFDGLDADNEAIDGHLKRLRKMEVVNLETAKAVSGNSQEDGTKSRASGVVVRDVRRNVAKGIIFTRLLGAKYLGFKHGISPVEVAKSRFADTPEVEMILRAPIAAMNTTDSSSAAPLVEAERYTGEFIELLRPATIIGRIPGLRQVPFNIKMSRGLTDPTAYWVGEGKVKPVSSATFDTVSLGFAKVAGIVAQTEELMRFSTPSSEVLVRDGLIVAVSYLIDRDFLDPTKAATDISPASITYGVTPVVASGVTADALRADLNSLMDEYEDDNMGGDDLVFVMNRKLAGRIGRMRNTLGQLEFPGLDRSGGTLDGVPVVTSNNIVSANGSPADGSLIVAINASSVLLADDGGVEIDISREASLQMESSPDSPTTGATNIVSLWQHNMVAIRAERFINWKKARTGAVNYINGAKYTG